METVNLPARVLGPIESIKALRDALKDQPIEGDVPYLPLSSYRDAFYALRERGLRIVDIENQN